MVKQWGGEPLVTAGSTAKIEFCKKLGATEGFDYKATAWKEHLTEGVDIVFDPVGGPRYTKDNVEVLNKGGRWLLIGLLGGLKGEIHLGKMLKKNIMLQATTLRDKSLDVKKAITERLRTEVLSYYENRDMVPVVDRLFDIREADQAHQYMKDNKVKGKIVLTVPEDN